MENLLNIGVIALCLLFAFILVGIASARREKRKEKEDAMFNEANKRYEGDEDCYE